MPAHALRRDELLHKVIDTLLSTGVSDLSLRPLASAVGSSARLLIYHFGSKEELLKVALHGVRRRIEASIRELSANNHSHSVPEFLRVFWQWAAQDSSQRYFRLLFEISGLTMRDRAKFSDDFWQGAGFVTWVVIVENKFEQLSKEGDGPPGLSTFVLATLNGLLRDLVATGDLERTTDALEILIRFISTSTPQIQPESGEKKLCHFP